MKSLKEQLINESKILFGVLSIYKNDASFEIICDSKEKANKAKDAIVAYRQDDNNFSECKIIELSINSPIIYPDENGNFKETSWDRELANKIS